MGAYVCMSTYGGKRATSESLFLFLHVSLEDCMKVIRLGGMYLYLLSYLACQNAYIVSSLFIKSNTT